uniref:Uncharacterized protein n=1 Tax=Aegilops tauschii TaxID=37682 RepID=R7WCM0_AEGTA
MGDYTIRVSTSLIEQLARDDEKQVKRRTRKPKPRKVVEQPEEPQDNGRELPTEPKSSPAPVLPFPPPMYLPVTPAPPPPPPAIQEVEAIRAVVVESGKVLEKLQKKEATMRGGAHQEGQGAARQGVQAALPEPLPVHRREGRLRRVLQEQRAGPA